MNQPGPPAADTLVGSLCREIWDLRNRARQIQAALQRSKHLELGQRLEKELQTMAHRRLELQQIAAQFCGHSQGCAPSSASALLLELCRRPLVVA